MRCRIRFVIIGVVVSVFLLLAYWESGLSRSDDHHKNARRITYTYVGGAAPKKRPLAAAADLEPPPPPNAHVNISLFKAAAQEQNWAATSVDKSSLHVMILARMRTGSTLAGEIFNQNPDVFYLFEPLHTIDCYVRRKYIKEYERMERSRVLLNNLNTCHFSQTYVDCITAWGLGRFKSNVLRRICDTSFRCNILSPETLAQECVKYENVFAMKMIRANLEMIRPLVTEKQMNIKIIHLIRDPRGTANSRKRYYNDMLNMNAGAAGRFGIRTRTMVELGLLEKKPNLPYKVNTLESLCQWMRETVGTAKDHPEWLKGRYKIVRYEDMAHDPIRITKDIYDFVGLDLSEDIVQWVRENTNTTEDKGMQTFSTHKNSSATASSWRQFLTYKEVLSVQKICGDVMNLLGYPLIEKPEDLVNPDFPVTKSVKFRNDIVLT